MMIRMVEMPRVKYRLKRLRGKWYANEGLEEFWPSMGSEAEMRSAAS